MEPLPCSGVARRAASARLSARAAKGDEVALRSRNLWMVGLVPVCRVLRRPRRAAEALAQDRIRYGAAEPDCVDELGRVVWIR
jgi:hypothetical protein